MTPVTDPARICKVLRHPAIWPHVSDDFTPIDWQPPMDRLYLMPDDDSACFTFTGHSGTMVDGHLAVLPEGRERGVEMALQALDWLKAEGVTVVIGFVAAENCAARRFVERVGFVQQATVPRATARNGRCGDNLFFVKGL